MKVRRAKDLNKQLGRKAIIDGYVGIPVFAYYESTLKDYDNYVGCKYVFDSVSYYAT
jgi:hypothetical protein